MAKKQNTATPPKNTGTSAAGEESQLVLWLPVIIAVIVFGIGLTNLMTGIDDHAATTENPAVKDFSLQGLFTNFNLGMYAPLTWLGYAIGYAFGGPKGENPVVYHLLSLLVHAYSTWLVVRLLMRMNGQRTVAVAVGILFAAHPIQVESVAWIAGFSTPLYAMFSLLACHAWLDYAHEEKGANYYLWALGAFLLACLSKSAAVTLPLMLLVLDLWKRPRLSQKQLIIGYIPLFLISIFFGLLTIYSRMEAQLVVGQSDIHYTLVERLMLVTYTPVFYWIKMLLPLKLNIYYSFDKVNGGLPVYYYIAPVILAVTGWLAWRYRHTAPYIYIGILFFFANILVTLPFAPMGQFELRADHYNYLACIGIFYLLVQGALHLAQQARFSWLTTAGALWITACIVLGMMQVRIWKDMITVVSNAIDNGYYQRGMMHFARGVENGDLKRPQEAIKDFTKALELKPDLKDAYKFRGSLYAQANQIDLAVKDLETYLSYDSTDVVTWNNMAMIYMRQNQLGKSLNAFTRTIELKPDAAISYQNRARIYQMMGNVEKANQDIQKAKELASTPK